MWGSRSYHAYIQRAQEHICNAWDNGAVKAIHSKGQPKCHESTLVLATLTEIPLADFNWNLEELDAISTYIAIDSVPAEPSYRYVCVCLVSNLSQ